MLINCPECDREGISDRAAACPDCGFPVREWVEERKGVDAEQAAVASRKQVGTVDCLPCGARGFIMFEQQHHGRSGFGWCPVCGHSGRVVLCQASDGYYAVSQIQLEGFLAGELHTSDPGVDFLGATEPEAHRYPEAGKLTSYDALPEWFVALLPTLLSDRGGE